MSIEVDRGTLGLKSIRVRDNGHGIAPEEAADSFHPPRRIMEAGCETIETR